MRGQFLIAEWLSQPWAIRHDVLANHTRVLARWLSGRENISALEDDDGRERINVFEARKRDANIQTKASGGYIAVIPVYGTMVQRAGMMTQWCGGTSTQQISSALQDAMDDDSIGQILMEFDTPGGSVFGISELGDEINAAKNIKPIIGFANSLSASAGYWLMSQCSECYITPGGEVGSIGVWMAHDDYSKAMDEEGIKTTMISAGKYKVEGNPYSPLDEEAQAFMQKRVDDYYKSFISAVASGRNVSTDFVKNGMGQGRVLGADQALSEKMVDGIMTMDNLIRKMQGNAKSNKSGRSAEIIQEKIKEPVITQNVTTQNALEKAKRDLFLSEAA